MVGGVDSPLPAHTMVDGQRVGGNTYVSVHATMLLQVAREYSGLSDVRDLTASEIRFFYEGLRAEIKRVHNGG